MLDEVRTRIKRLFSSDSQPTLEQAETARHDRADLVARLQQDVRRLQREISDLNDVETSDANGVAPQVDSRTMAVLHNQLSEKQAELARYQARI